MDPAKKERAASHAGFHFLNLYQSCQWKWYIKTILGIEPSSVADPLINGAAFHEGKATWYQTQDPRQAIDKCIFEITDREDEFYHPDGYQRALERTPTLLKYWIETWGHRDLDTYDFLAIEKEMRIQLVVDDKTKFYMTTRPDAVVREKKGAQNVYILETKTSSFSINLTEMGVANGDQATSYICSVQDNLDVRVSGVIPDIAYWNKNSKGEHNISCVRGDVVVRSPQDIEQFRTSSAQVFLEMAQKATAVRQGKVTPQAMFARNTYYCNAFNKACEFVDICRRPDILFDQSRLPPDFKRTKPRRSTGFGKHVVDHNDQSIL
jgi:hypothetical protein